MCTRVLWNDNKLAVVVGRTLDWPDNDGAEPDGLSPRHAHAVSPGDGSGAEGCGQAGYPNRDVGAIQLTNRYQWDAVFPDGDIYKKGVGGQGLYISAARDVVVAYSCTGDGNGQEETMARAIVKAIQ